MLKPSFFLHSPAHYFLKKSDMPATLVWDGRCYRGHCESCNHRWDAAARTDAAAECPVCCRLCWRCKKLHPTHSFFKGEKVTRSCHDCRGRSMLAALDRRRAKRAKLARHDPDRAQCSIDELSEQVVVDLIMRADRLIRCRSVRAMARLTCTKMERSLRGYYQEEFGRLDDDLSDGELAKQATVSRLDLVWFGRHLGRIDWATDAVKRRWLIPPGLVYYPCDQAGWVRQVVIRHGSGHAMVRRKEYVKRERKSGLKYVPVLNRDGTADLALEF